jgi:spermidine synthase
MEILGSFDGRHGKITVVQERTTGARLYLEEGVKQSYVLPGGSAGLDYVRLMGRLLQNASDIALFGCGGGALATELHRCGRRVTVVDDNAISFEIARRYFWMPSGVACVSADLATFLGRTSARYGAIGVDVGGPDFDYEKVLDMPTCILLRQRLAESGRIAINIATEWVEEDALERIAARLRCDDLKVWICVELARKGRSALIVAARQDNGASDVTAAATSLGFQSRRAV